MMADDRVYADQWKACADLMRAKAVEFDELAKNAPLRPTQSAAVIGELINARSFIDLAKGTNFPDEFVVDMAACMKRLADLLDKA